MERQLNIFITANNTSAFYAAHKIASNILVEVHFGLYNQMTPQPSQAFNFIKHTDWYGYVTAIETPLENPQYGELLVDFDNKIISFEKGVDPFAIQPSWLISSVDKALKSEDGYITPDSIFNHIQQGRIYTLDSDNNKQYYSKEPLQFLKDVKNINQTFYIEYPEGWIIDRPLN